MSRLRRPRCGPHRRGHPAGALPDGVGHAAQAGYLRRRHDEDGLDVVRLSPGFLYGPGGLFASAFVEQARRGRLRCIGRGDNWWSCVHVDDLAAAYVAALTRARAGTAYAVVDDEPLRCASSPTSPPMRWPGPGPAPCRPP